MQKREPRAGEQKILDERPEHDSVVQEIVDCWHQLDTARYPGPCAMGPIPYPAIELWSRRHGYDDRSLDVLVRVIAEQDCTRADRISSEMQLKG